MKNRNKVLLISLGCAKNLVDSEHMLGILDSKGFEFTASANEAYFVLINTCGFLESSVKEAIDTILESARLKKEGRLDRLVVTGCLVQRYGYKLRKEIPEVDGWLGTGEIHRVADMLSARDRSGPAPLYISRPLYLPDHNSPKVQATPFYTAYLRIAEGCTHRCSFCIIPALRGPMRSRSVKSLTIEAKKMVGSGVKEFNLVAQDTGSYGEDLKDKFCLEDLLEKLIDIRGIRWIRLMYVHPNRVSERLLDLIESTGIISPYLDLPLQHVNESILRAMGRDPDMESPWRLIERIRARKRKIAIRTTLMVGFPGETEEMFDQLSDFVNMVEFDHLGVFVFSPEKGTAAARFKSRVEPSIAQRRLDKIMSLQAGISKKLNQRLVGQTLPVLIEGECPETDLLLSGRTATMAPEVDGNVLINKGEGMCGEIMPVRITQADTYDLIGEIVGSPKTL